MNSSFVIDVGGSPEAVRALAEWFRHQAESAANDADRASGEDAINASQYWQGASGEAFTNISFDCISAAREIQEIAGPFAETLHVYAGELERTQEHFRGFLEHARSIGLHVEGTTVYRSVWNGAVPQLTSDPSWDEWRAHEKCEREYGRIQRDVVNWHADLEVWIAQNLVTAASKVAATSQAEQIRDRLKEASSLGISATTEYVDPRWEATASALQSKAEYNRGLAAELVRKSGVTRNPALRDQLADILARGVPGSLSSGADTFDTFADYLHAVRGAARHIGTAGDVVFGTWDVIEGKPVADVAIDWLGSSAGGAVGVAVAGALALPVGWAVALTVGSAVAIGEAVSSAWESTPASWRQGIYHFMEDGYIVAGDIGEAVGDWFYDMNETLAHRG